MTTKAAAQDAMAARETLSAILPAGSTVFVIIRSVAASGMSRTMDLYTIVNGDMRYLTGYVAKALHMRQNAQGALKVSGTGMDMAFSVVYDLSCNLFAGTERAGYILTHRTL